MVVRSATVYYGRGHYETLFADAEDTAEADKQLLAKIEQRVERLIVAMHFVLGGTLICACAIAFAWSSYLGGSDGANGFLPTTAVVLALLMSRPVVALAQRANAWSHEQMTRHQRAHQCQSTAIRPDWTWK